MSSSQLCVKFKHAHEHDYEHEGEGSSSPPPNTPPMTHTDSLPLRTLPGLPRPVSALCYGAVPLGTSATGEAMDRLFSTFLDAGGNFFDTAHCYCCWLPDGDGVSERTLGELVRRFGVRDRVVIATKGGHPSIPPVYPNREHYLSPDTVTRDLDESLRRLGMDVVDLYYLHRDDERVPVGEIMEMLNGEIARGRVLALGASNWRPERLEAANAYATAHGLQGFTASQPQFSLAQFNVGVGDTTLRIVDETDIAWHTKTQLPLVSFTSTAAGYFADSIREGAMVQFDNPISQARRARARQLAAELGATPTQIALAWLMHQPFPLAPAIGTGNLEHLKEALGAARVALTAAQVRWLREG